jgi:3-isopropylmalate/(R)-2-methylmalate dehydratase small subunit
VILPKLQVDELLEFANETQNNVTIDLQKQEVHAGNKIYQFEVDAFKKHCLLEGLDDIGLTLQKSTQINSFETSNRQLTPWLYE